MNILLPKKISAASLGALTDIPAIDTSRGEVEWVPSGSYAVQNQRVYSGVNYECTQAHTGSAALRPDLAPMHWRVRGPSNRAAPFDNYLFTKARRLETLTYEIPGVFIDGVALYGVEADNLSIRVTAGPGGADLIPPISMSFWEQAFGEFEYLFGELSRGTYYTLKDIPIHPDARVIVTLSRNSPTEEVAVGFISVGNWKTLLAPVGDTSGVEYGVRSLTKDYGITEENKDGTYTEYEGRNAKDISLSCVISADQAPAVDAMLGQISRKAVAIEVSNLPKYRHLATVGKVSGVVISSDWRKARSEIEIRGNV